MHGSVPALVAQWVALGGPKIAAPAVKAKSDKVSVLFISDDPQPNDNDLIAYYSTSGWHVVSQMPGAPEVNTSEGGLTYFNGKITGSDVVANPDDDTTMVANLTFHELMHNKLNLGNSMHNSEVWRGARWISPRP